MKNQNRYLFFITILLAVYYLVWGIFLNKFGYSSQESLFYIEKTRIVFDGVGAKLKVMGLTAPIIPFYSSIIFSSINPLIAPVIASAVCTALLFWIMAGVLLKLVKDEFYLSILLAVFLFHPGILYVACSGKSIALVLIFFFLFFLNLIEYYRSNTTYHVSIASICLVMLIFCDYKFIWLTLFFIPLILAIAVDSLNLGEKESIFRLFVSFNNPSLRRKLINKTFALYIILFILPLACVISFKLLNLTHANNLNYTEESPYATWAVLAEKLNYDQLSTSSVYRLPETSLLISIKIVVFCPLIILAIYLFRKNTYQILTLLTPFAFVEFLHIKYEKVYLAHEYYLIFLILSLLAVLYKANTIKDQATLRLIVGVVTIMQLFTGYIFLKESSVAEEQNFVSYLFNQPPATQRDENLEIANYLNSLPAGSHVLVDDAIAFPVVALTKNIQQLTLPYQDAFVSAIEAPDKYVNYILLATAKNDVTGFTQLNNRYVPFIRKVNSGIKIHRVYETDNWVVYNIYY
ncbi:MAG TPA: hypothetical protein VGN20_16685 [Mucilaginibacter sp.]|jgi:hypothetical protein